MQTPSRQIYLHKSGIYCFLNKLNNKRYIGQAKSIYRRFISHTKISSKHTQYFANAIKKYGWDNFEFIILEECSIDKLNEREEYWILHHQTLDKSFGYNFIQRMDIRREPRTEDVKEKIRNTIKTNYPNGRIGNKNSFFGKTHSKETKKIIGLASKGRITYRKPVIIYNQKESKFFLSITHAAKELNISRTSLHRAIKNNKDICGYFIKYS